jgi:hypothetical protein
MSFANIKAKKSNLQKLQAKAQENAGGNGSKDERQFKHSYDETSKVGSTLIRFLPRYDEAGEIMLPWASWGEYSFKIGTNNYWNRSLVTIGQDDPVAEMNKEHWEIVGKDRDGPEAAKARKRNLKKRFIANIVVLDDPAHPENNGQSFLYSFGPAIQQILEKALFPEYADQKSVEFYDWMEGANFRIRSNMGKNGWMSYDDSQFEQVSPLANGDQAIQEAIYNKMFKLDEFESDDNYKTYDELKEALIKTVGGAEYARVMGIEFTPATAAAQGVNPFAAQQAGAGQQTAPVTNPFAAQQAAPEQQAAPQQQAAAQGQGFYQPPAEQQQASPSFVQQQAAPQQQQAPIEQQQSTPDPFKQQQQAVSKDPFAAQQAAATPAAITTLPANGIDESDPFANLQL